MNRLTDFQRRMIVLGIAALMVLLGVAQAFIKTDFFTKYKKIIDEGTFILMLIAFVLLFGKKKLKPEDSKLVDGQKQVVDAGKIDEQDQMSNK